MNTQYKVVNYVFNKALWAQVIADATRDIGRKELAEIAGVDHSTISNWSFMHMRPEVNWPSMMNFVAIVNLLDLDPTEYFILEDI